MELNLAQKAHYTTTINYQLLSLLLLLFISFVSGELFRYFI